MNGVWNKIMPHRKNLSKVPEVTEKIDQIVEMGKELGMEDLNATTVQESLKDNIAIELITAEDLIQADEELNDDDNNDKEDDVEEIPKEFSYEKISKVLQLINEAGDLLTEHDPDSNRAMRVKRTLMNATQCYRELKEEQQKKRFKKQTTLTSFFTMKS